MSSTGFQETASDGMSLSPGQSVRKSAMVKLQLVGKGSSGYHKRKQSR